MHGWQANLKRTCASPVTFRVLPENEIPPVLPGDFYYIRLSEINLRQRAFHNRVARAAAFAFVIATKKLLKLFGAYSRIVKNISREQRRI